MSTWSKQEAEAALPSEPILRLDPGMHTAPITRIDVDAAGRFLVTGSDDKTVRVWSLEDGRLLRTLRVSIGAGHVGKVFAVAISPDGAQVAAGIWAYDGGGNSIVIFERASGRLPHRIDGLPSSVFHLAFSPDGRHLIATFGEGGIRVFETGVYRQSAEDLDYGDQSYWAAFDRAGRLATTSWDGRVRLYDLTPTLTLPHRGGGDKEVAGSVSRSPRGEGKSSVAGHESPSPSRGRVGWGVKPSRSARPNRAKHLAGHGRRA